jgi:PRTRC genetic system protein A
MMAEIELFSDYFEMRGNYAFVQAEDGAYLIKKTCLYEAQIKLEKEEMPPLRKITEKITIKLPEKIPSDWVQKSVGFFRKVLETLGTEAILIIYYHPEKEEFRIDAPMQVASAGQVRTVEPILSVDGFLPIGSFHSHGCGSAFHSSGDVSDEKKHSGLHIVCGNLQKERPDWRASIDVHGRRIEIPIEDILELENDFPSQWMTKIRPM